MSIQYQYNKANDTTYVYEVQSYYVSSIHQSRKKKRLIGKLDPSGQVIPTGPRGRPRKNPADPAGEKDAKEKPAVSELEATKKRLAECAQKIDQLNATVSDLKTENTALRHTVDDLTAKLSKIQQIIGDAH